MQFRNGYIRRVARLLCGLEVTKVQLPTLHPGNLDKPQPGCTLGVGSPLATAGRRVLTRPRGVVQGSLTICGQRSMTGTELLRSYQLSNRVFHLVRSRVSREGRTSRVSICNQRRYL